MYKKYLHTLMYKHCCNVVLLLCCCCCCCVVVVVVVLLLLLCCCCVVYLVVHLYSKHYIELFFMSRQNTTFSSKVGETGVGEQGIFRYEG